MLKRIPQATQYSLNQYGSSHWTATQNSWAGKKSWSSLKTLLQREMEACRLLSYLDSEVLGTFFSYLSCRSLFED